MVTTNKTLISDFKNQSFNYLNRGRDGCIRFMVCEKYNITRVQTIGGRTRSFLNCLSKIGAYMFKRTDNRIWALSAYPQLGLSSEKLIVQG